MGLTEFPERFQLIDEEPWKTEGIRKIVVNNFLVCGIKNSLQSKTR